MIKKVVLISGLLAAALTAAGQQKYIADKVVAVVGNSHILYSEVAEQAKQLTEEYRKQEYTSPRDAMSEALERLLEQKLLYNQALIDSVEITRYMGQISSMVNGQVEQMTAEAGSVKALETQRRMPLYSIRDKVREDLEEYFYAHAMRGEIEGQVTITPGEVDRFYRKIDKDSLPIVPEQYSYAQITRLPKSTELAKQRAREKLLELRQRIIDGDRFDRLAVIYSKDTGSAMKGGEMDPAPKESFVEPFANALAKLRPGQVSGVVETEFGFHIIQLMDKPSENLYHLRHILIKPTYTDEELNETVIFLDSLAGIIRKGDITFSDAAKLYSDDAASKLNGGLVSDQELLFRYRGETDPKQTRTRFVKDNLDVSDYRYLSRLKPGEISTSFIGTDFQMNQVGKILKLIAIIPPHKADLAQDYLDIEEMAISRKRDAHYRKWLDSKIDEMYVRVDPMFKVADFDNKRWFK